MEAAVVLLGPVAIAIIFTCVAALIRGDTDR